MTIEFKPWLLLFAVGIIGLILYGNNAVGADSTDIFPRPVTLIPSYGGSR